MTAPPYRFREIVVLTSMCLAGVANAQEGDCNAGVYLGKIGHVPVTMALDSAPDPSSGERRVGSLYYRVSMVDMLLKQDPGQPVWTEFGGDNKPSGRITLRCDDEQLHGEWISLDGNQRLPVAARRSPGAAYDARRFSALGPIEKPATAQARSVSFPVPGPTVQGSDEPVIFGIQLSGSEPGLANVNRLLWKDLLDNTSLILDCSLRFRQRFGQNAPALGFEQVLSYSAGPYAVVSSRISFECGDGMGYGAETATYQLTDGRKVDSAQWFKPELSALQEQAWRFTPLAKLIRRAGRNQANGDDAECLEAAEYRLDDVHPGQEGFTFRGSFLEPFKWCRGTMDVTLPFSRLAPFLSPEGKRAAQAIQKAPKPAVRAAKAS
jgi:hypothetical protein